MLFVLSLVTSVEITLISISISFIIIPHVTNFGYLLNVRALAKIHSFIISVISMVYYISFLFTSTWRVFFFFSEIVLTFIFVFFWIVQLINVLIVFLF